MQIRKIWAALLLALAAPAAAADRDEAAVAAIDAYFVELTAQGAFNGAVLIGHGDQILFQRPYGMADFELGVPLRLAHIFRIGSLTKPVTASAVLRSVGEGRISLEAPICAYLEVCLESWRTVTVGQVLSHRSGIADHFGDLEAVPVADTRAELRRAIGALEAGEPLVFEPGSDYAYSNFNYVLLGAALEAVYDRSWRDVIRDLVSGLDAPSLDYDDVYALLPERVRGYSRTDEGTIRNIEYDDHSAYAAGGLRSTIGDFFRWSRAALQGQLFSDDLRDRMVTPPADNYGYGWQVRRFVGERIYNHTGGIDGFATHIAYYPDHDLTIIVFSNVEEDSALLAACDAAARYFDFEGRRGEDVPTIIGRTPQERCGV